eukprot:2945815-Rhodomonas_salina.1
MHPSRFPTTTLGRKKLRLHPHRRQRAGDPGRSTAGPHHPRERPTRLSASQELLLLRSHSGITKQQGHPRHAM